MIPSFLRLSRCAQLNTRRLWNADGTVHAVFHPLSTLILRRSIAVACIQEIHAPDFASLHDDQPRGPHTAGAALDLVFPSVALRAGSFIVHQGDECCSLSPLCSPACSRTSQSSSCSPNFPVVLDWEPVLLAARAKLDDWETAMQELLVPDSELPQRCAIVVV